MRIYVCWDIVSRTRCSASIRQVDRLRRRPRGGWEPEVVKAYQLPGEAAAGLNVRRPAAKWSGELTGGDEVLVPVLDDGEVAERSSRPGEGQPGGCPGRLTVPGWTGPRGHRRARTYPARSV